MGKLRSKVFTGLYGVVYVCLHVVELNTKCQNQRRHHSAREYKKRWMFSIQIFFIDLTMRLRFSPFQSYSLTITRKENT